MNTAISSAQTPSFIQRIFGTSPTPAASPQAQASAYGQDQVLLSQAEDPNNQTAGFFTKMSDSIGNTFSEWAFSMKMGSTYKHFEQEYLAGDADRDGRLTEQEGYNTALPFNKFATPDMVITGGIFGDADKNGDGVLSKEEYIKSRKENVDRAFKMRDLNGDYHLNLGEIGSVGRILYANHDGRMDRNLDGQVSRREFMRAHLTLGYGRLSEMIEF